MNEARMHARAEVAALVGPFVNRALQPYAWLLPQVVRDFFFRQTVAHFGEPFMKGAYLELLGGSPLSKGKHRDVAVPPSRLRDVELLEEAFEDSSVPATLLDIFRVAVLDGDVEDAIDQAWTEEERLSSETDELTAFILSEVGLRFFGVFGWRAPGPSCENVEECRLSVMSCAERAVACLFATWVAVMSTLEDERGRLMKLIEHLPAMSTYSRAWRGMTAEDSRAFHERFVRERDISEMRAELGPSFAEGVAVLVGLLDRLKIAFLAALPDIREDEARIDAMSLSRPPPASKDVN